MAAIGRQSDQSPDEGDRMYPQIVFNGAVIAPSEIERRATQLAARLSAAGLYEGDVVGVMMRNQPAYLEIMLACNLIGVYYCSINWHFKSAEAGYILKDSGAKMLFIQDVFLDQIGGLEALGGIRPIVIASEASSSVSSAGRASDYVSFREGACDGAYIAGEPRGPMTYTSGSTGRPKGVRRLPLDPASRPAQIAKRDEVSRHVFGIAPDSRCFIAAPLYHSAPFSYATFAAAQGATIFLEERFDEARLLDLIETERLSHLYLVPTMYQRLLRLPEEKRAGRDLSSVQFVASTGSPCGPELKRQMIEWWGPVINETYASTETGYVTAIGSHDALRKPGSAGRLLPHAELKILGDDGSPRGVGEIGLIYAVQRAYPDFTYANNQAARAAIDNGGLITLGDMGYLDEEGFLFICDRKNDMVISGGVNIYPAEIEAAINELAGVRDSAVFGIPDAEFGEALAAAIQLAPLSEVTEADVREHLRERIANYKVPKRIDFYPELPREDTGKIFKRRLRDPFWQQAGRSI
jgi:long-chain acyl-CoA synthetase